MESPQRKIQSLPPARQQTTLDHWQAPAQLTNSKIIHSVRNSKDNCVSLYKNHFEGNYLVFPKLMALLLYPFLIGIAMFLGIGGGYVASVYGGFGTSFDYIEGIQIDFVPFHIAYAFIKTFVFAFFQYLPVRNILVVL